MTDLHEKAERLARDLERFDSLNIRKQAAETLRALLAHLAEVERERDELKDVLEVQIAQFWQVKRERDAYRMLVGALLDDDPNEAMRIILDHHVLKVFVDEHIAARTAIQETET